MNFKIRKSTEHLYVITSDLGGLSVSELRRKARRSGDLDVGFHFYISDTGTVEAGRPIDAIAGHDLENPETSVYILVDTRGNKGVSDSAQKVLDGLTEALQSNHPGIKIHKQ